MSNPVTLLFYYLQLASPDGKIRGGQALNYKVLFLGAVCSSQIVSVYNDTRCLKGGSLRQEIYVCICICM